MPEGLGSPILNERVTWSEEYDEMNKYLSQNERKFIIRHSTHIKKLIEEKKEKHQHAEPHTGKRSDSSTSSSASGGREERPDKKASLSSLQRMATAP